MVKRAPRRRDALSIFHVVQVGRSISSRYLLGGTAITVLALLLVPPADGRPLSAPCAEVAKATSEARGGIVDYNSSDADGEVETADASLKEVEHVADEAEKLRPACADLPTRAGFDYVDFERFKTIFNSLELVNCNAPRSGDPATPTADAVADRAACETTRNASLAEKKVLLRSMTGALKAMIDDGLPHLRPEAFARAKKEVSLAAIQVNARSSR